MIASGGCSPAAASASSAVVAVVDVVAGAAEIRLQRAQELRLVVDDENPLSAHAGTSDRQLDDRQGEHERRALPLARLDPQPAAVRLREAARDRQTEPRAALVGLPGHAIERLEDLVVLLLGNPRPAVGDADQQLLASRVHAHVHRLVRR